jgi:hypothetical protein
VFLNELVSPRLSSAIKLPILHLLWWKALKAALNAARINEPAPQALSWSGIAARLLFGASYLEVMAWEAGQVGHLLVLCRSV